MDVRSDVVEGSSSQMVTRQQRKRAVDAVIFRVLDNPSLREEILKHVIFGKDGVDRKAACTLRLLEKSWNDSVLRILRQAHKHLFKLGGHPVDPFVSTFAASTEIMGSVPPLAIFGSGDISRPKYLEGLSNCLTRCGDGWIRLQTCVTDKGRPVKTQLPNCSLPLLHTLQIGIELSSLDSRPKEGEPPVAIQDDGLLSTRLMKSVLSNATALTELNLMIHSLFDVPSQRSLFTAYQSVVLPPTITKITVYTAGVRPQVLELLARSPLPNLTCLVIHLDLQPADELLFRVLDNCRKSLKTVAIKASGFNVAAYLTRFPLMEQLQEISIDGMPVQPKLEGDESLDKYFPKLTNLRLLGQTDDVLRKWAGSSPVPGVTSLKLFLQLNLKASLPMGPIQLVNFAFPNLRKLEVHMPSGGDSSGLQYIFMEMKQLTELGINVECNLEQSTDTWDSLLTGVPVEVIARSRADPEFWENNDLEGETIASIKNLSELKRFSLNFRDGSGFYTWVDGYYRPYRLPSISDFLFNCALLKMPKLMQLHLLRESTYNVSQEMIAKWRNVGRSLTFDSLFVLMIN